MNMNSCILVIRVTFLYKYSIMGGFNDTKLTLILI